MKMSFLLILLSLAATACALGTDFDKYTFAPIGDTGTATTTDSSADTSIIPDTSSDYFSTDSNSDNDIGTHSDNIGVADSADTGTGIAPVDTNSDISISDTETETPDTEAGCDTSISVGNFCKDAQTVISQNCLGEELNVIADCGAQSCYKGECICPEGWTGDSCTTPVFYVNVAVPEKTGNSGRTWAQAFNHLQLALAATVNFADAEIWVARGRYIPGDTRDSTFQLIENVRVYGGFAGNEKLLIQRDIALNETILDGDINRDDLEESFLNHNENVYHVISGADNATLDGFSVRGGNANGAENYQDWGGGLLAINGLVTISNCTFKNNQASSEGGGIYIGKEGGVAMSDIKMSGNRAKMGGAVSNEGIAAHYVSEFFHVTFENNAADLKGGAIYSSWNSFIVSRSSFIDNYAKAGGAIFTEFTTSSVQNCVFKDNDASENGGALYISQSSNITITNNSIVQNQNSISNFQVHTIEIVGAGSKISMTNNIVWGNQSDNANAGSAFFTDDAATSIVVSNSIMQDGCTSTPPLTCGANIFTSNPLFVDEQTIDGLQLSAGSPCIDAGNNDSLDAIQKDMAGNPRIMDGNGDSQNVVDMGAFEFMP
ncbi:MAG: hypothetical protein JXR76_01290 [Deltaproteobacteria bacterium]|nr:hypothetical protein [Deltaproteobacteria bacterium]